MSLRILRTLAALALTVGACTDGQTDATTAATLGTTTTMAATATSAPGLEADPLLDLFRVDDPSFDGGFLNAVVAAGPGLVAVGSDELPEDAAVWVSVDGTNWERVESEAFSGVDDANGLDGTQSMTDVVDGPAGLVAVGWYERRADRDIDAGVWLSSDGLEWNRIEAESLSSTGPDYLFSVTNWNGLYVAAGEAPGPVGSEETRPAIWVSEDGSTWDSVASPSFRLDGTISAVVSRGSRLFAAGTSGHVARPTVWFSDDGLTWDMVTSEDVEDSVVGSIEIGDIADDEDVFMNSIVVTPDGFVAGGGTGEPSRAVFWNSTDGLFWTLRAIVSDIERPNVPVFAEAMATTPGAVVAVGSGRLDTTRFPPLSYAEVWVSQDGGTTWGQIPRTSSSTAVDGPWHIGWMTDVIAFADGLVMVGFVPYQDVTLPGPFYHQAVWMGDWTG